MSEETKTEIVSCRFSKSGSRWLSEFAKNLGLTLSETIRLSLNTLLREKQLEQAQDEDTGDRYKDFDYDKK